MDYLCRIHNAKELVVLCSHAEKFKKGEDMNIVEVIEDGTIIIDHSGRIAKVGKHDDVMAECKNATFQNDIDASNKIVLPGLVDSHTHPVWSGDRVNEFLMKLNGASYMDIHKAGGGIGFTVGHTQASSEDELLNLLLPRLDRMIKQGTTLVECKSGYGLEQKTESKMLRVLHRAKGLHPIDIVSTFLGAHSIPKGSTPEKATKDVIYSQLPIIDELKKNNQISSEFIDVFCEQGVFSTEQSREILLAGKQLGYKMNFHGDELHPMKAAELSAEVGATAISHLEWISDKGIEDMVKNDVIGVLLPTTAYCLRIAYPPARQMISSGMAVAIASDYNPNAHCLSMPFVMNLSCIKMGLTVNEALVASTLNAAASIDKSHEYGSLEVGKYGDCVILNTPSWPHLIYELVDPPIEMVIKKGVPI